MTYVAQSGFGQAGSQWDWYSVRAVGERLEFNRKASGGATSGEEFFGWFYADRETIQLLRDFRGRDEIDVVNSPSDWSWRSVTTGQRPFARPPQPGVHRAWVLSQNHYSQPTALGIGYSPKATGIFDADGNRVA